MPTKHSGIKTRFKLDNASGSLTDISRWLNSIQPSSDANFEDATTFQPDVVGAALKEEIPGFASKGFSLAGMWDETIEAFFSAIEGLQNLEYQYKPDDPNMNSSITGLCSCGSYSGPITDASGGPATFTAELSVTTRSFNQGSAGSPVP